MTLRAAGADISRTGSSGESPGSRVVAFVTFLKTCSLSGCSDVRSPVTVAGAAAVSHRVPIQSLSGNLARAQDHTDYLRQVNQSLTGGTRGVRHVYRPHRAGGERLRAQQTIFHRGTRAAAHRLDSNPIRVHN